MKELISLQETENEIAAWTLTLPIASAHAIKLLIEYTHDQVFPGFAQNDVLLLDDTLLDGVLTSGILNHYGKGKMKTLCVVKPQPGWDMRRIAQSYQVSFPGTVSNAAHAHVIHGNRAHVVVDPRIAPERSGERKWLQARLGIREFFFTQVVSDNLASTDYVFPPHTPNVLTLLTNSGIHTIVAGTQENITRLNVHIDYRVMSSGSST